MSEIISFGFAMCAVEQGKWVQYSDTELTWFNLHDGCLKLHEAQNFKWRIKPTPVKYSVDIWLNKEPKIDGGCIHLDTFLFGTPIGYAKNRTDMCNKHFKITVESCDD
jgi:hypothetical protein